MATNSLALGALLNNNVLRRAAMLNKISMIIRNLVRLILDAYKNLVTIS